MTVRLRLANAEAGEQARAELVVMHDDMSPSVFVNAGIELEDQQYVDLVNSCVYVASF